MVKVASSLTNTISTSGTTAISSTQAYNAAATFTAAAAKANRVQPELSSQVCRRTSTLFKETAKAAQRLSGHSA